MRTITIALLLTATAFCATERAKYAEIKLASGEVLKEVAVMSQTPTHITVLVAAKMRQIKKTDLPPELQKAYPVDEEAARARHEATEAIRLEVEKKQALKAQADKTASEMDRQRIATEAKAEAVRQEQKEAALAKWREAGRLKGNLGLELSNAYGRSATLKVINIGSASLDFEWRQVSALTRGGDRIDATACQSKGARFTDYNVAPGETKIFELGFGVWGNYKDTISDVQWR